MHLLPIRFQLSFGMGQGGPCNKGRAKQEAGHVDTSCNVDDGKPLSPPRAAAARPAGGAAGSMELHLVAAGGSDRDSLALLIVSAPLRRVPCSEHSPRSALALVALPEGLVPVLTGRGGWQELDQAAAFAQLLNGPLPPPVARGMRRLASGAALLLAALALALLVRPPTAQALRLSIDGQAIADQLAHLAQWSDDPSPAVTRLLFTGAAPCRRAWACAPAAQGLELCASGCYLLLLTVGAVSGTAPLPLAAELCASGCRGNYVRVAVAAIMCEWLSRQQALLRSRPQRRCALLSLQRTTCELGRT